MRPAENKAFLYAHQGVITFPPCERPPTAAMTLPFHEIGIPTLLLVVAVLLVAGTVKGAMGAGLPMIALPPIAAVTDPVTAIAIMTISVISSNAIQAVQAGHVMVSLRRFWTYIVPLLIVTTPSAILLTRLDTSTSSLVFGGIVLSVGLLQFAELEFTISESTERWLSPVLGVVSGVFNGFSSLVGPILIIYLLNLRLAKDALVGGLALVYLFNPLPIYISFAVEGVYTETIILASALALLPVLGGVALGMQLRGRLSELRFRQALTALLLVAGLNLIAKGVGLI